MSDSDLEPDPFWSARLTLDERGGPALRLPKERARWMVEHALDEAFAESGAAGSEDTPDTSMHRRVRSFGWLACAAAVLLALAGGAFAALRYWSGVARKPPTTVSPVAAHTPATPPSAASTTLAPAPLPGPAALPQSTERQEPRQTPHAEATSHQAPDDLLQAANRLRAQGRFAAAAEVYALVYERHPGSIAAYTAEVARATIELEHRDNPHLARTLFTRALRHHPSGALDIEARQGLALSLRDLGDNTAEARALRELVAAHPGSPAAERARAQLRGLEGRAR